VTKGRVNIEHSVQPVARLAEVRSEKNRICLADSFQGTCRRPQQGNIAKASSIPAGRGRSFSLSKPGDDARMAFTTAFFDYPCPPAESFRFSVTERRVIKELHLFILASLGRHFRDA
jgi:hypothetical protein